MSAWMGHVPFGMYMVDLLRPKAIAELGTHYGVSYCAFCQAVKELGLDTRCYAIDTWKGDDQSGLYGPEVLADLEEHHNPLYGGFSRLIQSTFDGALNYFPDHSFDLLHIDGFHTSEAVKRDFDKWLPKLTERGVILFHDINVREREFGVWKFWNELKLRYPHFEFVHSHGLGVLAVGNDYPKELNELFQCAEENAATIRAFFSHLGTGLESAQELQAAKTTIKQLSAREKDTALHELNLQLSNHAQQLHERNQQMSERNLQLAELTRQLEAQQQQISERDARLSESDLRLQAVEQQIQEKVRELEEKEKQLHETHEQLQIVEPKSRELGEQLKSAAASQQQLERQIHESAEALAAQHANYESQLAQMRDELSRERAEHEAQSRQRLEQLQAQQQLLETNTRDLTAQLDEAEANKQQLEDQIRDSAEALAAQRAVYESQLAEMTGASSRMSAEYEAQCVKLELSQLKIEEYANQRLERNQSLVTRERNLLGIESRLEMARPIVGDLLRVEPDVFDERVLLIEIQQQLTEKEQYLRAKDLELQETEQQIVASEQHSRANDLQFEEMEEQIAEKERQLRLKDRQSQEIEEKLRGYIQAVDDFGRSGSYRVGRALSWPFRQVRKLFV